MRAFYDSTVNGTFDTGEPTGTVSITWKYPPPIAVADTYSATGNVRITVPVGSGLFSDDTLNNGTLDSVDTTGTQGDVSVNPDGSFTYNPKAGFTGADTFTYTLTEPGRNIHRHGYVNVSNMIWFINNDPAAPSGNNGRLTSPFNSLASFTTAGGGATGDVIFIYESGNGNYTGGISSERLAEADRTGSRSYVRISASHRRSIATRCRARPVTRRSRIVPAMASRSARTTPSWALLSERRAGTGLRYQLRNTHREHRYDQRLRRDRNLTTGTLAVTLDAASSSSSTGYGLRLSGVGGTLTIHGTTSITSPTSGGISIDTSGSLTTTLEWSDSNEFLRNRLVSRYGWHDRAHRRRRTALPRQPEQRFRLPPPRSAPQA